MTRLHFLYRTTFHFKHSVNTHSFALRCIPSNNDVQKIQIEHYHIEPADSIQEIVDGFGNHRFIGLKMGPHIHFEYEVSGVAEVDSSKLIMDPFYPIYRYESKFVKFTPELRVYAKELLEKYQDGYVHFTSVPSENRRVAAGVFTSGDMISPEHYVEFIMNELFVYMVYERGVTNISTTAGEAFLLKKGVCQDYAHIFLALCRMNHIPARYVVGLMIGEGATHAWVEIYNGTGWIGFDPTNNQKIDDYYVKIAHGRDYEDCVVDKGRFYGNSEQNQKVYVYVEELV